jgi:hypothetical protein
MERFTGVRRDHDDIDVVILRSDAPKLLEVLEPVYHAWANAGGTLTPMMDGRRDLPADAVQIWVRRGASSPWEVDFGVAGERDGRWVWRHDPTVSMGPGRRDLDRRRCAIGPARDRARPQGQVAAGQG